MTILLTVFIALTVLAGSISLISSLRAIREMNRKRTLETED